MLYSSVTRTPITDYKVAVVLEEHAIGTKGSVGTLAIYKLQSTSYNGNREVFFVSMNGLMCFDTKLPEHYEVVY